MELVAKVYAKALYEVVADKKAAEKVLGELRALEEAIHAHKALREVMHNPAIAADVREEILLDIAKELKASASTERLLRLLAKKGRVPALTTIVAELERLIDGATGVVSGELKVAAALPNEEVDRLADSLAKRVGGKVRLKPEIDPTILGGFVARVGGKTYDASIRTQLSRVRNENRI